MKSTRETYLLIFWGLRFDLPVYQDVTDKKCEKNNIFHSSKIFENLKHFFISYSGPEFNMSGPPPPIIITAEKNEILRLSDFAVFIIFIFLICILLIM